VADHSRIDELRRRVDADPASIAFAQLAEEYRRIGEYEQAVRIGRRGLARHPDYVSARVTLGRALFALGDLDGAQAEFALARRIAPDNLAAIRGLAELHQRRGELEEALGAYRAALTLARNDPDLQSTVTELAGALGIEVVLPPVEPPSPSAGRAGGATRANRDRTARTVRALERWLEAILEARARREADPGR